MSKRMSETEFWKIIAKFNWKKLGDDAAVIKPAVNALAAWQPAQIRRFEHILAKKLYQIDGIQYAREIGEDAYVDDKTPFSVDWFLYARCVVVANGKEAFAHISKNPADMPKDMDFEALLDVARQAYAQRTGEEFEPETPLSYETFSNKALWLESRRSKPKPAKPARKPK